jgi:membrane peptidoglycan carboxypeptidase
MIAPHFVNFIEQELVAKYGEEAIQSGGLTVISTLDLDLQAKAEEVVKKYADLNERDYKVKNMALLSEDPKTGQILAMVGSRDFFNLENEGNFNAVFGLRQPGSSFKPFAYLTLFKKGYTDNTILFDLPTNFSTDPQNPYTPKNYDKKFRGPINLRNSLAQSLNIPSVKVLYLAGITDTINTAKSFGITTLTQDANYYGLPLVLGGGAVNLYEMVGGYAAFSQEGIYHKQSYILKVIDRDNKILEEYKDKSNPVCDAEPVRLLNDILADNLARAPLYSGGINNPLFFGDNIPVAAKTGTSQDSRDA